MQKELLSELSTKELANLIVERYSSTILETVPDLGQDNVEVEVESWLGDVLIDDDIDLRKPINSRAAIEILQTLTHAVSIRIFEMYYL